jgi:tetratricopeptide (TPR) repeat protein
VAGPGPFDDVLGGEPEADPSEPGGPREDPFAAALALNATTPGAPLDPHTAAYVDEQTRLIRLQVKHYDQERRLAIGAAKRKRFGDRLRNLLVVLVCLGAVGAIVGLAAMAWGAAHDKSLVVDAFSVPPDFAQRGLTGQVVARQILDKLTVLQAQSTSMRAAGSFRNNWGDNLKVEIPQTGVSIGELRDELRAWLGHETRISGEVYRTSAGVTLTTRVGDAAASFSGAEGDLEKLTTQSAEAIYGRAQPYRYAIYLDNKNRVGEARAVLEALSGDPDTAERAWAELGLGLQRDKLGDPAGCVRSAAAALRDIPGFAPALTNLVDCEMELEHDHEALKYSRRYLDARQSVIQYVAPDRREFNNVYQRAEGDQIDGDYSGEIFGTRYLLAKYPGRFGDNAREALAAPLVSDHDAVGAREAIGIPGPNNSEQLSILGLAALELGDPAALGLLANAKSLDGSQQAVMLRRDVPWLAIAKARFGDLAAAQALIATTPTDCYLCVRGRGMVAAAGGDKRGAERWFAQAIRQGPDLPQAFTDRGAARLTWGDVAGALADARRANAVSPRNPDALKLWGDVLARQGRWQDARAKYDAALTFAPAWTALRQVRAAVAGRRQVH